MDSLDNNSKPKRSWWIDEGVFGDVAYCEAHTTSVDGAIEVVPAADLATALAERDEARARLRDYEHETHTIKEAFALRDEALAALEKAKKELNYWKMNALDGGYEP